MQKKYQTGHHHPNTTYIRLFNRAVSVGVIDDKTDSLTALFIDYIEQIIGGSEKTRRHLFNLFVTPAGRGQAGLPSSWQPPAGPRLGP